MIAGDNDTCDKFFAGINYTSEQLLPVTTTLAITFFAGVVDTSQNIQKAYNYRRCRMPPIRHCW
jgi:hypothetical protein